MILIGGTCNDTLTLKSVPKSDLCGIFAELDYHTWIRFSGHGRTYIEQLINCVSELRFQMEESLENYWISHLEMEEDNLINQNYRISHYPYLSSTTEIESATASALVEAATTNFQSSIPFSTVQNTLSNATFDTLPNNEENSLSTHILPLMNTSVEPPMISNNRGYMKHGSALGSFKRTQVNHSLKARTSEGNTKKVRSSSETANHTVAERKRRQKLTENFIALSAIIPGLKKIDKSYILQEAINYMKQLQERVIELENQKQKKLQLSINEDSTTSETNLAGYRFTKALPEVKARVSEKNVLISIHCEKQNDIVYKILNLLTNLPLSITSSSLLQFGAYTLQITIIAQMEDEYNINIDDMVKNLRKELVKSHNVQQ
ncbi:transcription factor bHLH25-like [Gastrolobium bilobum]|uniref:transcription factor bHLH25-like n=1 Tax=Gastrolobium bilobum TaxID=150636 RepID=UPI002AB2E0D0|nr:transcription factor bHLH25-like [Gastrolobium bilobum]